MACGGTARTATSRRALLAIFRHHQPRWDEAFVAECDGVFSQTPQPQLDGVHILRRWPGDDTTPMAWWVRFGWRRT